MARRRGVAEQSGTPSAKHVFLIFSNGIGRCFSRPSKNVARCSGVSCGIEGCLEGGAGAGADRADGGGSL